MPLYEAMRDRLFDAPGVWSFLQCPQCGLVWLNPRPMPGDKGKVYSSYYTHAVEDRKLRLASLRKAIKHALLATAFGYEDLLDGQTSKWLGTAFSLLAPLKQRVGGSIRFLDGVRKGKLLDVGCGNGRFLAMMRDLGWEVVGVEPDRQAARIAQERFGIPVMVGTLEDANFSRGSFDAVTINQVIEHVYDPIALLQACRRVIKPNGQLVVVTPNIESLGHAVFRESWIPLDPPRHLHLFSLWTLRECARRAGLQIETLSTLTPSAPFYWAYSRLIHQKDKLTRWDLTNWQMLEGIGFWVVEEVVCRFRKSSGEALLLIATKDAA